jgi:chromosome segregation ATPase
VEDGDKSHLRRVAPPGREWHPSNVAQLGSAAADLLSSLGYSKEVGNALSLSADEASVFMKSLMDKVREGAEKGRAYDQLKSDHDREVEEGERLQDENEDLKKKVNSLQESLQSERKAHEEEMKRKFAELNEELAKEKESARRLRATVTKLSGELEQAKKRAKDAEDHASSLESELKNTKDQLKEANDQLDKLEGYLKFDDQWKETIKRGVEQKNAKIEALIYAMKEQGKALREIEEDSREREERAELKLLALAAKHEKKEIELRALAEQ